MSRRHLDYLVIGHVTRDRMPEGGFRLGGTVAYAARTAQALGCRVGVITGASEDLSLDEALPDIRLLRVPASVTTTFENRTTPQGRVQTIQAAAPPLTSSMVHPAWRFTSLLHLGPVAGECEPGLADLFPNTFLGLTPQGWMRAWDGSGRVHPAPWKHADILLPRAAAVVLSEEDISGDEALAAHWATRTRALALTRGAAGCTVYAAGEKRDLPGHPVLEVDSTGAGDIFAAVFFVRLWQGDDPWTAARLANCVAAISVTRPGLSGTPTPEEIAHCRALCA